MYNHETEQFEGEEESILYTLGIMCMFPFVFIFMALSYLAMLIALPFYLMYDTLQKLCTTKI